jgi:hypothetical protein
MQTYAMHNHARMAVANPAAFHQMAHNNAMMGHSMALQNHHHMTMIR